VPGKISNVRRFGLEILRGFIWRIFLVVILCSLVVFFGDFRRFLADFLSYVAGKFSCGLNFWTFENVEWILVADG